MGYVFKLRDDSWTDRHTVRHSSAFRVARILTWWGKAEISIGHSILLTGGECFQAGHLTGKVGRTTRGAECGDGQSIGGGSTVLLLLLLLLQRQLSSGGGGERGGTEGGGILMVRGVRPGQTRGAGRGAGHAGFSPSAAHHTRGMTRFRTRTPLSDVTVSVSHGDLQKGVNA